MKGFDKVNKNTQKEQKQKNDKKNKREKNQKEKGEEKKRGQHTIGKKHKKENSRTAKQGIEINKNMMSSSDVM